MLYPTKERRVQTSVSKNSVASSSFATTNLQDHSSQTTTDLTQKKRLTDKPWNDQQGKKPQKERIPSCHRQLLERVGGES